MSIGSSYSVPSRNSGTVVAALASSYSNHFTQRTRVATALNDDVMPMDDNKLQVGVYVGGNSHSGSVGAE
jgi:hypothetical protein